MRRDGGGAGRVRTEAGPAKRALLLDDVTQRKVVIARHDQTVPDADATMVLDFEGHGIGKLLVPLVVRRQAASEMPKNQQKLKHRLESGA